MLDTIVLDLDGTLVSSITRRIEKSYLKPHVFEDLFVHMRPCAPTFVKFVLTHFKHIYIWSDSELSYIRFIINLVFGKHANRIDCILHRRDCNKSLKLYGVKKDLRYIKFKQCAPSKNAPVNSMVLVDNMDSNINKTQNYVIIKTLELEDDYEQVSPNMFTKDKELRRVMDLLKQMGAAPLPPAPKIAAAKPAAKAAKLVKPVAKAIKPAVKVTKPSVGARRTTGIVTTATASRPAHPRRGACRLTTSLPSRAAR